MVKNLYANAGDMSWVFFFFVFSFFFHLFLLVGG